MRKSQHTREYRRLIEALREAREQSGFTQQEVAKRLRVYASFVSKCESGERRLDVVELAEFCRIYDIDLVSFLRSVQLCD